MRAESFSVLELLRRSEYFITDEALAVYRQVYAEAVAKSDAQKQLDPEDSTLDPDSERILAKILVEVFSRLEKNQDTMSPKEMILAAVLQIRDIQTKIKAALDGEYELSADLDEGFPDADHGRDEEVVDMLQQALHSEIALENELFMWEEQMKRILELAQKLNTIVDTELTSTNRDEVLDLITEFELLYESRTAPVLNGAALLLNEV